MKRIILSCAAVVWITSPNGSVVGSSTAECSRSTRLTPPPGFAVVLARPTADSVQAELDSFDWYDWAGDSFTPKPAPSDSTWGQVFQVLDVLNGDSLEALSPGEEFVAVPWTYDPACHPESWDGSSVWVGPDEQVFFLQRHRRSLTPRGPAFDVLGWHSPYPGAEFLRFEARDEPRSEWLSADTYFEFLRGFDSGAGQTDWDRALRDWRSERPGEWAFPLTRLGIWRR